MRKVSIRSWKEGSRLVANITLVKNSHRQKSSDSTTVCIGNGSKSMFLNRLDNGEHIRTVSYNLQSLRQLGTMASCSDHYNLYQTRLGVGT